MLTNSLINKTEQSKDIFIKNYFIRDFDPPYYSIDTVSYYYKHRMMRYAFVYTDLEFSSHQGNLIKQIPDNEKKVIEQSLDLIKTKYNLSIQNIFLVLRDIFCWFFNQSSKTGFNYSDPATFYISEANFKGHPLLNLIQYLSSDLKKLQESINKTRRDPVKGVYRGVQSIFDYPIFKPDEKTYCIIDLKLLFQGICGGLRWHMYNSLKDGVHQSINLKEFNGAYGKLIEIYFRQLMKCIFKDVIIPDEGPNGEKNTKPDAVIKTDQYILIFEFTTSYYKVASLYNQSMDDFNADLDSILFDENDGKLHKLARYIQEWQKDGKKIIPILMSENFLGDYDLLMQVHHFKKQIENIGLKALIENKPVMMSLDDLEMFLRIRSNVNPTDQFVAAIQQWENANKGSFMFHFNSYLSTLPKYTRENGDFDNLFDFNKFLGLPYSN